jgi:hypothetical protein
LAHSCVGAITSAIFSKTPLSDAVAGAMGSILSIAYMEAIKDKEIAKIKDGNFDNFKKVMMEIEKKFLEKIDEHKFYIDSIVGLCNMLFKLDPNIGLKAGGQAIQYDFMQTAI